jgi:hypothetical protein
VFANVRNTRFRGKSRGRQGATLCHIPEQPHNNYHPPRSKALLVPPEEALSPIPPMGLFFDRARKIPNIAADNAAYERNKKALIYRAFQGFMRLTATHGSPTV